MDFLLEIGLSRKKLCTDNTTWACLALDLHSTIRPKAQCLESLFGGSGVLGELLERCPRLLLVSQDSLASNAAACAPSWGPTASLPSRSSTRGRSRSRRGACASSTPSSRRSAPSREHQWSLILARMCALPANEALVGDRMKALIAAVGRTSLRRLFCGTLLF